MLKRLIAPIIGLVVVLGGGGLVYNAMHPGAKSCNSLVDTANEAIDVFNKASTEADLPKVVAQFKTTSAKLRKDSDDYKSPFDKDAVNAADDLDAIVTAINAKSESGVNAGITKYNADVSKTNTDCKDAR